MIIICAAGTPGKPFGGCMRHFNMIEANMKLRYSARLFHDVQLWGLQNTPNVTYFTPNICRTFHCMTAGKCKTHDLQTEIGLLLHNQWDGW